MKRRYYVIVGRNEFAENFVRALQDEIRCKGSGVSVLLTSKNCKVNGCRVLELPVDQLYLSAQEINAVGETLLEFLISSGWMSIVSDVVIKDCMKLHSDKVLINFMVVSKCKSSKNPGFIFYWVARSKRI